MTKTIMTKYLQSAITFAIKTHEVYQKQVRKGKDISYTNHPLTVGLLLAKAGADDEVIAAGILHDTIEDSSPDKPVTKEMITDRFGKRVASIVYDVSEKDKSLSWKERKQAALEEIKKFSQESLLVKSADLISNISELIGDYQRDGNKVFSYFNASLKQTTSHYIKAMKLIVDHWEDNPFRDDLIYLIGRLEEILEKER